MPETKTLEAVYRRIAEAKMLSARIQTIAQHVHQEAQKIQVPTDLTALVQAKVGECDRPWDAVIAELVAGDL